MDNIIIIDGLEFEAIKTAMNLPGAHKLSVTIDGDTAKFKVNESMWSPGLGRKREDY